MSDFTITMKNWRRMCMENSDGENGCHNDCPLLQENPSGCGAIYEDEFSDKVDWAYIEDVVDKWAEDNTEPVYPSWKEWLISAGFASRQHVQVGFDSPGYYTYSFNWEEPIPKDIAEKLGIKPKGGGGS